jgi:hypothetical protein
MDHIAWSLVLLAAVLAAGMAVHHWRRARETRFQIERHGLRLRQWRPVTAAEKTDPWRCPECALTAHGHWAKLAHEHWHNAQNGTATPREIWDSASAAFQADRDAGTPELADAARPELEG